MTITVPRNAEGKIEGDALEAVLTAMDNEAKTSSDMALAAAQTAQQTANQALAGQTLAIIDGGSF